MRDPPQCDDTPTCSVNCCTSHLLAALFYIMFLTASKLIILNIVVAMLAVHLNSATREAMEAQILQGIQQAEERGLDTS